MSRRIFIWVAHPRSPSLCSALADAYQEAAEKAGAEVRRQDLAFMQFDKAATIQAGDVAPPLEPDLQAWQDNVSWAQHVLVVHPLWWGVMPGVAKAMVDRVLLPGWAFRYHESGKGWDKLLEGRTADAVITSDTPSLIDRLVYHMTGRRSLKNQMLGFCGIKLRRVRQFGEARMAGKGAKATRWIAEMSEMGRSAAA